MLFLGDINLGAFASCSLAIGAILVWWGWYPRRTGSEPRCRKCDYELTGLQSERCPECGSPLTPRTIRRGLRKRRVGIAIAGTIGIVLGVASLGLMLRGVDVDSIKPSSWLIRELESKVDSPRRVHVMRLLGNREIRGELSKGHRDRIIGVALVQQTDERASALKTALMDYLTRHYLTGALSVQQTNQFFRQMAPVDLAVRPVVAGGDVVPFQLEVRPRIVGGQSVKVIPAEVQIDGNLVDFAGGMALRESPNARGRWNGALPPQSPGEHELTVTYHIQSATTLQKLVISRPFKILRQRPADDIRLVGGELLDGAIRNAIKPQGFDSRRIDDKPAIVGFIKFAQPPASVAFDVFARFGGKEFKLTSISQKAGGDEFAHIVGRNLPEAPPGSMDIILRSSQDVARETVELHEIWRGELVYSDVPVIPIK